MASSRAPIRRGWPGVPSVPNSASPSVGGNGGCVQRYERTSGTARPLVDHPCHKFLAGADGPKIMMRLLVGAIFSIV